MKLFLIMNPGSRSGRGKSLWRVWERGLQAAGVEFESVQTQGTGHAFELARAVTGFDVAVAVGGDGTINEVLDGVMQSGKPDLAMGVLYSGTSPDFCKFHGIPVDPQEAVRSLLTREPGKVDVVRIAYHGRSGAQRMAHLGCSCNVGMGASIARHSNRWRRYIGDSAGTAAAVLRTLASGAGPDVDLEIDGESEHLSAINNLSLVKNPYLASGLKLKLGLRPDDGDMWVVGVHGKSTARMLGLLPRFYTGTICSERGVLVRRCRSVSVRSSQRCEIEFDGDPRGFLPVRVEVLPRALNLRGGSHE